MNTRTTIASAVAACVEGRWREVGQERDPYPAREPLLYCMGSDLVLEGESQVARSQSQHELLERLGAAVVSEWNDLPMTVRKSLFERAARVPTLHEDGALKAQLARFLHDR